jgi:hypothetical protein
MKRKADVQKRGGHTIFLQVDKENGRGRCSLPTDGLPKPGPHDHWQSSPSRLRMLRGLDGPIPAGPPIRPLPGNRWQEAYELDRQSLPEALDWPEALAADAYKRTWWQRLVDFLNGRHAETWSTLDSQNRLNGLAAIYSEWGRSHHLLYGYIPPGRGSWNGRYWPN